MSLVCFYRLFRPDKNYQRLATGRVPPVQVGETEFGANSNTEISSSSIEDHFNTPLKIVFSGDEYTTELPKGVPENLPVIDPKTATIEQLEAAVKPIKPKCTGLFANFECGNHEIPSYSGPLIAINPGDELAMNSMLLKVVNIDANGNGTGMIKVPMMNQVQLGVDLIGIKAAEGGCITEGSANLNGVELSVLNKEMRDKLAEIYVKFNTAIDLAQQNAGIIAQT